MHMLTRRLIAASAAACAVTVALAGCTPPDQRPTPTSIPTTQNSPAFASDQDALKAATDAYAAYLKMSDTIAHDGGANPERIKPYVTGDALKAALKSAKQFREAGAHSTGDTSWRNPKLKVAEYADLHRVRISFYICDDVSGVDVVDSVGESLVSDTRPAKATFEVDTVNDAIGLVITSKRAWSGSTVCD
jgi:hypothetical protein